MADDAKPTATETMAPIRISPSGNVTIPGWVLLLILGGLPTVTTGLGANYGAQQTAQDIRELQDNIQVLGKKQAELDEKINQMVGLIIRNMASTGAVGTVPYFQAPAPAPLLPPSPAPSSPVP